MGRTHLVIGDPHATPDAHNERFDWLGKLIVDRRPDVIVCMGDFADMPSLSSYDKGKKDFHGRRYEADIGAAIDAQQRIFAPVTALNEQRRANKKALYKPEWYMLGGNHDEARIERLVQLHAEFEGLFSVSQLRYKEHGWTYVPYEQPIEIDGIYYCHHFPTGNSGEPIGGVNLANSLIAKNMVSSTVGHSHILDIAMRAKPDGTRVWGLSAGCYFDHEMKYAKATQPRFWWAGVIMKNNVDKGDYSPEVISINEVRERYS